MNQKVQIDLSTPQNEFFTSLNQHTLYCGGLGSGKTFVGALWAINMALKYPDCRGLITANTYSQLKKATLVALFELLETCGIPYTYKSQDGIVIIGGTTVYTMSMEKYDTLRGIEVGWAWSDECAFYKEDAFLVLQARIRDRRGPCQWRGTTTPNGFNWLYKQFVEKPIRGSKVIYGSSRDNVVNLGEAYVDTLEGMYDKRMADQELSGQFVNLNSGSVYYEFDRRVHVKSTGLTPSSIYVGLDFNVHPLCGIFCFKKDDTIFVTDELFLPDSNTFAASKEIIKRSQFQHIQVVADESGSRRKTSSNTTDHEILRRAGLTVVPFKNPLVKDRYNNMNRLFGQNRIIIDPKCTKLIEDLEKLSYDNIDPMLSHVSDALGYAVWHLEPFRPPDRVKQIRYV